jgi:hypothetical protein
MPWMAIIATQISAYCVCSLPGKCIGSETVRKNTGIQVINRIQKAARPIRVVWKKSGATEPSAGLILQAMVKAINTIPMTAEPIAIPFRSQLSPGQSFEFTLVVQKIRSKNGLSAAFWACFLPVRNHLLFQHPSVPGRFHNLGFAPRHYRRLDPLCEPVAAHHQTFRPAWLRPPKSAPTASAHCYAMLPCSRTPRRTLGNHQPNLICKRPKARRPKLYAPCRSVRCAGTPCA